MALFLFTQNILEGKPIDVFNHGHHKRDFTFVDDIAEGVVRACDRVAAPNTDWSGDDPDPATSSAPYRIYNIGNNAPVDLSRYIEVLEDCLGQEGRQEHAAAAAGRRAATPSRTSKTWCATSATSRRRPWKWASARFVDWYLEYYKTNAPQPTRGHQPRLSGPLR